MPGVNVFLNYRRSDSAGHAGRLFDRLNQRFPGRVFRDVTGIGYGVEYAAEIERRLDSCRVLVVIIGPQWLTSEDDSGRRRLDDPDDLVRLEIENGLRRNALVIPILVGDARPPSADELPGGLKPLAGRNALEITEPDFDNDVERLTHAIANALGEPEASQALTPHPETGATRAPAKSSARVYAVLAACLGAAVLAVCVTAALIFYAPSRSAGNPGVRLPAPGAADAPDSFDAVGVWEANGVGSDYHASIVMSADHTYSGGMTLRGVYGAGSGTWEYGPSTRVILFHFNLPDGSAGTTSMEVKEERDGVYRATHSFYGDLVLRRSAPR
jgi:hypothetical protein